jgi:hypothetical protein
MEDDAGESYLVMFPSLPQAKKERAMRVLSSVRIFIVLDVLQDRCEQVMKCIGSIGHLQFVDNLKHFTILKDRPQPHTMTLSDKLNAWKAKVQ